MQRRINHAHATVWQCSNATAFRPPARPRSQVRPHRRALVTRGRLPYWHSRPITAVTDRCHCLFAEHLAVLFAALQENTDWMQVVRDLGIPLFWVLLQLISMIDVMYTMFDPLPVQRRREVMCFRGLSDEKPLDETSTLLGGTNGKSSALSFEWKR